MIEDNNNSCDPCEQRFEEGIEELVDQVKGYTPQEHDRKQEEVEAAFTAGETPAK